MAIIYENYNVPGLRCRDANGEEFMAHQKLYACEDVNISRGRSDLKSYSSTSKMNETSWCNETCVSTPFDFSSPFSCNPFTQSCMNLQDEYIFLPETAYDIWSRLGLCFHDELNQMQTATRIFAGD